MDHYSSVQDKQICALGNDLHDFKSNISFLKNGDDGITHNETCTLVDLRGTNLIDKKSYKRIQTVNTDWNEGQSVPNLTDRRASCDIPPSGVEKTSETRRKSISLSTEKSALPKHTLSNLSETNNDGLKIQRNNFRRHSTPEINTLASTLENLRIKYGETIRNASGDSLNVDGQVHLNIKTLRKSALPDQWYAFRDKVVRENQQKRNCSDQASDVSKLEKRSLICVDDSDNVSNRSLSPSSTTNPSPTSSSGSTRRFNFLKARKCTTEHHQSTITECDTETLIEDNDVKLTEIDIQPNTDNLKNPVPNPKPLKNNRRHSLTTDVNGNTIANKFHDTTTFRDTYRLGNSIMDTNIASGCGSISRGRGRVDSHAFVKKHHPAVNETGMNYVLPSEELVAEKQSTRRNNISVAAGMHQSGDVKGRRNSISIDKELMNSMKTSESKHSLNIDFSHMADHTSTNRRNSVAFGTRIHEHIQLPGRRNSIIAPIDHAPHTSSLPHIAASNARRRNSIGTLSSDVVVRSSTNESCKTGGRHMNERNKLKHNYPLQIQKLLKAAENEMPTHTLLEIKRLKERIQSGED